MGRQPPSAIGRAPLIVPRNRGGGLEASMSELGSSHSTVLRRKRTTRARFSTCASFQMPRSEGLMRPSGTTAVASVSTVPARQRRERTGGRDASRWQSVFAGVLAHRRNRDAVTKMNIANLECVEQIHVYG